MIEDLFSQDTLLLYDEATRICNKIKGPGNKCSICKYVYHSRCKILCLQKEYNILDIKNLQPLNINDYANNSNICLMSEKDCAAGSYDTCDYCLLEYLLKNPLVKIIKKEIYNEK